MYIVRHEQPNEEVLDFTDGKLEKNNMSNDFNQDQQTKITRCTFNLIEVNSLQEKKCRDFIRYSNDIPYVVVIHCSVKKKPVIPAVYM